MSSEFDRIQAILAELDLPRGQYAVSGSAVMFLAGLPRKKPMGDLDIFVATRLWFDLLNTGEYEVWTTDPNDVARRCDPPYLVRVMEGLEVNLFFEWRTRGIGDIDVNEWMANVEMIGGVPCVPLARLYQWKLEVGRHKDQEDIALLARHYGGEAA